MTSRSSRGLLAALLAGVLVPAALAQSAAPPAPAATTGSVSAARPELAQLEEVARFGSQVTGVTVSETGRVFVNFPRWTEDVAVSVAEVMKDGSIRPYPDENWNAWRNAKANELPVERHFVSVQSVVADGRGSLFVLDPASPGNEKLLPGGPKLVQIDLGSNAVKRVYAFGPDDAPQGTYLNDVRFSPDGRHAYITDSGSRGALIVLDLGSGEARRVLDGHPSTQVDKTVQVRTDGQVLRRTDGRAPAFAADGIALSRDGRHLYWQALTGKTLYRIETDALENPRLSAQALGAKVERVAETGVSDGLWIDGKGRLHTTALEESAVKRLEGNGTLRIVAQDERLRWPDTMAEGPDGALYVTSSRIQDMSWFKPESGAKLPTVLYRFTPKD